MQPDALISAQNAPKCVWRPGSARTRGGAHSAPSNPLAGFKGSYTSKGKGGGNAPNFVSRIGGIEAPAPEYKLHPLFLPKIWEKFIDKSHVSISRTLFCYFLARRNVLGCIHVMRRLATERQDVIDA